MVSNPYDPDKSARLAAEAAEALVGIAEGKWIVMTGDVGAPWVRNRGGVIATGVRPFRYDGQHARFAEEFAESNANARFIAYARSGVPALAAALQDANAEVMRLREALAEIEDPSTDMRFMADIAARALLPKETPDE